MNTYEPWTFLTFPLHIDIWIKNKNESDSRLFKISSINNSGIYFDSNTMTWKELFDNFLWIHSDESVTPCGLSGSKSDQNTVDHIEYSEKHDKARKLAEIMLAFAKGAKIQSKQCKANVWKNDENPTWNWSMRDYKLVSPPKVK